MANPEHLKILRQGAEAWNRWREENARHDDSIHVDELREADLRKAKLGGAELDDVNFWGADLSGADLSGADLKGANFSGAALFGINFEGAGLVEADLTGTDARDAKLNGADLKGADLYFANLRGAWLRGTSFEGATFGYTSLSSVDLSRSKGLGTVLHQFPSDISTGTLERTAAGLSSDQTNRAAVENFLRGAGVPESIMGTLALMIENPIEFYSSFISYSHADKSLARRLHDHLQARGIRCWLDEHDLKPGDRILDAVSNAIRLHDRVLLCCSEVSLNSWWVKDEIRKAQERERRDGHDIIIPLMVDRFLLDGWEDGMAADLRSRLAADFTGWEHDNAKFEEQFERVVKALKTDEAVRETRE